MCPAPLGKVLGGVEDRVGCVPVRVLEGDELGQARVQAESEWHAPLESVAGLQYGETNL